MSVSINAPIYIVCIGYPNAGKTSFFNHITKSHFKAVNYPGSTVQYHMATTKENTLIKWIDTPGIITFSPHADDEEITYKALTNLTELDPQAPKYPHLILYVADALQLERHLMGFRFIQSQGYPVQLVLTRADIMKKKHGQINIAKLKEATNCPVFFGNTNSGHGMPTIDAITKTLDGTSYVPNVVETELAWKNAALWAKKTSEDCLESPQKTSELDKIMLHPLYGGALFTILMTGFFFLIFLGAQPLMEAITAVWTLSTTYLHQVLPNTAFNTWIVDGLFANIGAVLVFIPQIFLLFLAMGILESTGYLARAAVIMDKPLSWLGLSGKSFVPILSGSACAIPAILATRNLTNKLQRYITLWMIPLMPCSARIPVYGLLLALLFPQKAIQSAIGMVVIYLISVVIAITVGKVLAILNKASNKQGFQIELPRWQMPYWPMIVKNAYRQTGEFIMRAGPTILVISVVVWALSQYPTPEQSWLAHIGQVISPIFAPMGWDWRIGVAVLASFAAREVFVAVIASMLALNEQHLSASILHTHGSIFSTPAILALITFFMISMQCGTTIAVLKREIGSWRVPITMTLVYTLLAYVLSVIVYQIAALVV